MVTFVLFHPAAFGAGVTAAVMASGALTVKVAGLLLVPATFTTTETGPLGTPEGTGTTMAVAVHEVGAAGTVPNFTVLVPCVLPKLEPEIVTTAPTEPAVGERLVMVGV
jgi:hypothetical protein